MKLRFPTKKLYEKSCFWIFGFAALLLSSCTIIDNDLRGLPDTPGFKEVVHEETDQYTLDYQFLETTRVFDDRALNYIVGIDYGEAKLYMNHATPDDVLPSIGQVLHHGVCDELPYGLNHRVTAVTRQNEFYAVSLERVALDEVFKVLMLESNVEVAGDFQEEEIDTPALAKQAAPPMLTRATNYNNDLTGDWHEFDLMRFMPSFHVGNVDIEGEMAVRWRPILKAKAIIDIEKEKFDLAVSVGTEWEIEPQITGTANFEIDLLEKAGLDNALSGQIPIVPQIALFLTYGFALDFNLSLSGSISCKFSKKSYVDFGGRYGMKAANGVYVKKHDTGIEINEIERRDGEWKWDGWDGDMNFSVSLMGGSEIKLLIGSPKEYPNVGIGVKGVIGPKLRTTYAPTKENYDKVLRTSIAMGVEGTLFLNIFKILKVDWNFTDAIAKLLGSDDGFEVDIPGTILDKRFYPLIDNMSIVCTNPKETGTPEFEISFDVPSGGMSVSRNRTIQPFLSIYPHAESSLPILEKNDLSNLRYGQPNNYKWKFKSDKLERDATYDVVVKIAQKSVYGHWDELCSRRYAFASVSPSILITTHNITAQTYRIAAEKKDGGYDFGYDWKFRTHIMVQGIENVEKWGFKVGNKTYEIDKKPKTQFFDVLWKLKNSKKKSRTLQFIPYVKYTHNGQEMINYSDKYTITLEYDPSMDDWSRRWGKWNGKDYYESGFDMDSDFKENTDVDMSAVKLASRRRFSVIQGKESHDNESDDFDDFEIEMIPLR